MKCAGSMETAPFTGFRACRCRMAAPASAAAMHYLSHAAWSMEHGVAALILADRIPRTDSNLDVEAMIDFSINTFLVAVVGGPRRFAEICAPILPKGREKGAARPAPAQA